MTQPCSAQKRCRSKISDWKLKALLRMGTRSTRPRAIGPAAAGCGCGDIGAADPARHQILGIDCWTRRRRAAVPQLAREPVQPSITHPGGDNDQDEYDQFGKSKHR